jgi:mRNA-degrading endonuclease toxin of MazEF toxin-antitoxin module
MNEAEPRRGEIWVANIGEPPQRHWVLVVSLDAINRSKRVSTILVVPFSGTPAAAPTVLKLEAGEMGLPGVSYVRGHFIQPLPKSRLVERLPRPLSDRRVREVCEVIRHAYDPDPPSAVARREMQP